MQSAPENSIVLCLGTWSGRIACEIPLSGYPAPVRFDADVLSGHRGHWSEPGLGNKTGFNRNSATSLTLEDFVAQRITTGGPSQKQTADRQGHCCHGALT